MMRSTHSSLRLILIARPVAVAIAGLVLLVGCGPDYVDTDNDPKTARGVPTDLQVDDDVDVEIGDKIDWKTVVPIEDGKASLVVRVGDPFRGTHDVAGRVVVFDVDAKEFSRANISPNVVRYDLTWEVEAEKTYLIMVEADKGKAPYSIEYSLEVEEKDPCEGVSCEEWEKCDAEGECVPIDPDACNPPCEDDMECDAGECVEVEDQSACKTKCKRGETCNRRTRKCVKNPCAGKKCPSGQRCRNGSCVAPPVKAGACDPDCASDEKCVKGVCKLSNLSAKVIQAIPQGKKTVLILSRGSNDKVKKGMTGKLAGVGNFTVKEVFPFRCKAVIGKASTELGNNKSATIYR